MSRSAPLAVGLSVEEFMAYDGADGKAELVRGELQMTPWPGGAHGVLVIAIARRLDVHVAEHRIGRVFVGASFELVALPRTVRAPDVAFVRADRLPSAGIDSRQMRVAPDLVVEVLSPSETPARLGEKLDDYRASGLPLVWLIDPIERTVTIMERNLASRKVGEAGALTGGAVVPGFHCEIRDLFEGLAPALH
jgi:Uma2 family endonuclease